MTLLNTNRFSSSVFFFWHWQVKINISDGKSIAYIQQKPLFVFELDFLFIRFWFEISETNTHGFTMLNRRLAKHK